MVEELEENDDQIHCLYKEEPQFYIKKEDHDHFFAETSNKYNSDQDDYKKNTRIPFWSFKNNMI